MPSVGIMNPNSLSKLFTSSRSSSETFSVPLQLIVISVLSSFISIELILYLLLNSILTFSIVSSIEVVFNTIFIVLISPCLESV